MVWGVIIVYKYLVYLNVASKQTKKTCLYIICHQLFAVICTIYQTSNFTVFSDFIYLCCIYRVIHYFLYVLCGLKTWF